MKQFRKALSTTSEKLEFIDLYKSAFYDHVAIVYFLWWTNQALSSSHMAIL